MTILVIEDSRFMRILMERTLTKAGYKAVGAGDGNEGLRLAKEVHPDLILLDMMLPGLDGTTVLRELKQAADTQAIPVIVLSGLSQKNEERLKLAGAVAYIEKSNLKLEIDGRYLLQAVKDAMRGSAALAAPKL
jgi:CheY-like chemotaxis protein